MNKKEQEQEEVLSAIILFCESQCGYGIALEGDIESCPANGTVDKLCPLYVYRLG